MGGNFILSISCSACSFSLLEPIIIGSLNMEETKGIITHHNIAKLFDYNICLGIKILTKIVCFFLRWPEFEPQTLHILYIVYTN